MSTWIGIPTLGRRARMRCRCASAPGGVRIGVTLTDYARRPGPARFQTVSMAQRQDYAREGGAIERSRSSAGNGRVASWRPARRSFAGYARDVAIERWTSARRRSRPAGHGGRTRLREQPRRRRTRAAPGRPIRPFGPARRIRPFDPARCRRIRQSVPEPFHRGRAIRRPALRRTTKRSRPTRRGVAAADI